MEDSSLTCGRSAHGLSSVHFPKLQLTTPQKITVTIRSGCQSDPLQFSESPRKPLYLRCMLSKSPMRCSENYDACSWCWSTERATAVPDCTSHSQRFKVERAGLRGFTHQPYSPDLLPTTSSTISRIFAGTSLCFHNQQEAGKCDPVTCPCLGPEQTPRQCPRPPPCQPTGLCWLPQHRCSVSRRTRCPLPHLQQSKQGALSSALSSLSSSAPTLPTQT